MGKNKPKGIKAEPKKQKMQESDEMKNVPLGFHKNNPTKSK